MTHFLELEVNVPRTIGILRDDVISLPDWVYDVSIMTCHDVIMTSPRLNRVKTKHCPVETRDFFRNQKKKLFQKVFYFFFINDIVE